MTRYFLSVVLIACLPAPPPVLAQGNISLEVLETFAIKGAAFTSAQAISNTGLVSGYYLKEFGLPSIGFIRARNGSITKGIVFVPGTLTFMAGINSSGLAVGYSQGGSENNGGFFYQNGIITPYNVPSVGAEYTILYGVNDAGDLTGFWIGGLERHSFARRGGIISNFTVPGAQTSGTTTPQAINNQQEIVGWYTENVGTIHGFKVQPNGKVIWPIDFPGAVSTYLYAVNDQGVIVGTFYDDRSRPHGLVIQTDGQMTQLDVPDALGTAVQGINNDRKICGYSYTLDSEGSFIARLAP